MTIERVETIYGPMWIPDTDTHQYGWLKRGGISSEELYIKEVCAVLSERPLGTALDIGASFGCWSLPLAAVCTKVIAIEPQFEVYRLLLKTLTGPDFEVINAAVGDQPGTARIPALDLDKPTNFGDVAISEAQSEQPEAPMQNVACVRIDDLLDTDLVTFTKVDVQGMEAAVLRGMAETIARCRPILFVEAHPSYGDVGALRVQIEAMDYYCLPGRGANHLAVPL